MNAALTRRAALSGAVASVAMVGVAAAAAMPIGVAKGISPGLTALLAKEDAAHRAADLYEAEVAGPTNRRYAELVAAAERQQPHYSVDAGEAQDGARIIWTTWNPAHVAAARTYVHMGRRGHPWPEEGIAAARKLQAAHLRRERAVKRMVQQAKTDTRIAEINSRSDAIGEAWAQAQDAVANFPAQTAADLAVKIERIVAWDMTGQYEALLDDARRLATTES